MGAFVVHRAPAFVGLSPRCGPSSAVTVAEAWPRVAWKTGNFGMIKPLGVSVLCLALGAAGIALADNDPNRPTDRISRDLGVTQAQFIACFEPVQPAVGERPTSERTHANKRLLLGCLQAANPAITNESLDTVMDRYRPGGREAQMPGPALPGQTPPPPPPPVR